MELTDSEKQLIEAIRKIPAEKLDLLESAGLPFVKHGRENLHSPGWGDEIYFALVGIRHERITG